jgi:hypothetical protein
MSHKIVFLALSAMLLALCVPAQAQQPGKSQVATPSGIV